MRHGVMAVERWDMVGKGGGGGGGPEANRCLDYQQLPACLPAGVTLNNNFLSAMRYTVYQATGSSCIARSKAL